MKPTVNDKGFTYWSYMLVYINNCLAVYHNPGPEMEELKSRYKLKNDTYGEPDRYLGANDGKYQLKHNRGKSYWSMCVYDNVVELCKMVRNWSEINGPKLNNKRKEANYCPKNRYLG